MPEELLRLRGTGLRFDAVMTSDDKLAQGALKICAESRPERSGELSIVGLMIQPGLLPEPELAAMDNKFAQSMRPVRGYLNGSAGGKGCAQTHGILGELTRRGTTVTSPGRKR